MLTRRFGFGAVMRLSGEKRFVGLGLAALKNNFAQLKHPYKLNFAITYWCQSRCLTCNIWQLKPKGELTLDEIREFARKNNHFRWIGITGGEPFLRSDIVDIIEAFVKYNKDLYLLTIPTNSLTNFDMLMGKIERILQLGIPKVSITLSLDGYREMHDKVRGVPGNFDKAMAIAKRFREMQKKYKNLFFIFGYTMSRFNQGALEATYQGVKREIPDVSYNNFHINVAQISDIYYNNTNLEIRSEREAIANELKDFISKRRREFGAIPVLEEVFLKNLVTYVRTGQSPMRSRSLDASLFLDSYGNVYPSIMWNRKIGNIRDTNFDLAPIWQGQDAAEVRRLIGEGKDPASWTACEAYQVIVGKVTSFSALLKPPY